MANEITDEMVERAQRLYLYGPYGSGADAMRAVLEAVAPRLRALGMREAAKIMDAETDHPEARSTILARAAELEKEQGNA